LTLYHGTGADCLLANSAGAGHAKIEFIYERSCPNIEDARAQLRLALVQTGLPAHWQEWEHNDPKSPGYARRFGSPTVLVDGADVAGEPAPDDTHPNAGTAAPSCRIYSNTQGRNRGVPDAALIRTALEKRMQNPKPSLPAERLQLASMLPAVARHFCPS